MRRIGFTIGTALVAAGCAGATPADIEPAAHPVSEPVPSPRELMSEPEEYRAREISAEAGRDYFMRTGVGDPYGAGMPYPVFLALLEAYPERLGGDWAGFNERFGTFADPAATGDPNAIPIGFHLTTDPNTGVSFLVVNCQICHTDRVALPGGPLLVPGMGNKRLRLHAYGRALMDIARDPKLTAERLVRRADKVATARSLRWPAEWRRPLVAATVRGLAKRAEAQAAHADALGDAFPGRVATVPGFIMALNHQYGAGLELPATLGWVKIPDVAVWRYRETNSFDGVAVGAPVALVAEADFAFGVRPRWYDEHRHIATSMFLFLRDFERELPYPAAIDRALAGRGYRVFGRVCSGCHGVYGDPSATGGPRVVSYRETLIEQSIVGTDRARLDAVTPEFVAYANAIRETAGLTHVRATGAYVPRPLIDVWARGLYGHNGQWPSIAFMAIAPDDRPRRFAVDLEGTYDVIGLGLPWRALGAGESATGAEVLYDAAAPGFGVGGHEFLSDQSSADKRAIIEYLKTL